VPEDTEERRGHARDVRKGSEGMRSIFSLQEGLGGKEGKRSHPELEERVTAFEVERRIFAEKGGDGKRTIKIVILTKKTHSFSGYEEGAEF